MEWLNKYLTQGGIPSIIPAEPNPYSLWKLWVFTLGLFAALFLITISILYIQRSEAEEQNIQN